MNELKTIYPNHPLFSVSQEKLKMWRNTNIKGNKFSDMHSEQILQVLEELCSGFDVAIQSVVKNKMQRITIDFLLQNNIAFRCSTQTRTGQYSCSSSTGKCCKKIRFKVATSKSFRRIHDASITKI